MAEIAAEVYVGRQPIYDRKLNIYAYELLYRRCSQSQHAVIEDADQASSEVVANALMEFGLEQVVGTKKAFFNFSRGFLVQQKEIPFSVDKVVIEVLEYVPPDPDVITAVKNYANSGHPIALDDFTFQPELEPLIAYADIIKVDIMQLSRQELEEKVPRLHRANVKLLAEKVETEEEFELCKRLGFNYFQGFYFSRPKLIRGRKLPPNRLGVMRLLAQLQAPDVEIADIEKLIETDVMLSWKLLKHINSSYYGLMSQVNSIRFAISYLGLHQIRMWCSVLAMCSLDDKPKELMNRAMVRARMCQLLAGEAADEAQASSYFTVGLFSILELLLDMPFDEILDSMPLADEVNRALLYHQGPMGTCLACALAYEQADWAVVANQVWSRETVVNAYLQAIAWADDITQQFEGMGVC